MLQVVQRRNKLASMLSVYDYGSRVLELAKNKFAVGIAAETDLIKALDIIKSTVLVGELNAQIDTAVTKLRAGFVK